MIGAERVDFVAVPTKDVEKAAEFYGQALGLEKNPNSLHDWIEFETGNVTLALVSAEGHGFEFAPLPPGSIALRVPDVAEARAELVEAGVEIVGETWDSGVCRGLGFRDPDGNGLMLHRRMEFTCGQVTLDIFDPASAGKPFAPSPAGLALRVPDVAAARAELEAKGAEFDGDIVHTSVCDMTFFRDPDGNSLILHRRFAPFPDGRMP